MGQPARQIRPRRLHDMTDHIERMMEGHTGSATIHYDSKGVRKVEFRILVPADAMQRNRE